MAGKISKQLCTHHHNLNGNSDKHYHLQVALKKNMWRNKKILKSDKQVERVGVAVVLFVLLFLSVFLLSNVT